MKKEYVAPEMDTVDLKNKGNLILCNSLGDGDELGLASHEQDPIA